MLKTQHSIQCHSYHKVHSTERSDNNPLMSMLSGPIYWCGSQRIYMYQPIESISSHSSHIYSVSYFSQFTWPLVNIKGFLIGIRKSTARDWLIRTNMNLVAVLCAECKKNVFQFDLIFSWFILYDLVFINSFIETHHHFTMVYRKMSYLALLALPVWHAYLMKTDIHVYQRL